MEEIPGRRLEIIEKVAPDRERCDHWWTDGWNQVALTGCCAKGGKIWKVENCARRRRRSSSSRKRGASEVTTSQGTKLLRTKDTARFKALGLCRQQLALSPASIPSSMAPYCLTIIRTMRSRRPFYISIRFSLVIATSAKLNATNCPPKQSTKSIITHHRDLRYL